MAAKTYYLTTPIYYVNDVPHIGTAYTTVLADVLARYRRGIGQGVFFLTGTDEHGQKAEDAAKKRGLTPQAHCDELQQRFRDAWTRLEITNDDFVRTTEPRHVKVVQAALDLLWKKGEIYAGEYEGWYHAGDEIFVTEKDIEERGLDRAKLRRVAERNYFFKMGAYRERLVAHIESHPSFIRPEHRRNEILGFLKKGLDDLCISRPKSRLAWGIPLPFDDDFVTYVWFDALLNYVSVPGFLTDPARFATLWPADVHLMGKDILTTHAVYWPTMLMALGVELPKTLLAHGWWTLGGDKMSKSLGNVVNPLSYADRFGVDALRYFFVREMNVGQDAEFSDERFRARYDADLGNDWGNLLSRSLTMIGKFSDGKVPAPASPGGGPSGAREAAKAAASRLASHLDDFQPQRIAEDAMAILRAGNQHVDATQPWKAAKDPAKAGFVRDALYTLAEAVRVASVLLSPITPAKGAEALRQLGVAVPTDLRAAFAWGGLVPGTAVAKGEVLFPRVEPEPTAG